MLHIETVSIPTLGLLRRLQTLPVLAETRLVGGTALALQLGHRKSVDLDFFGKWDLSVSLLDEFAKCGRTEQRANSGRKLQYFEIAGVTVDCVTYDAPWLDPPVEEMGLRLAGERDIAAMKLFAVANRGVRKDFIDLWFLVRRHGLENMLRWFMSKYLDAPLAIVLRSLVYFDDAEDDPMPIMLQPFDWDRAKDDIRAAVRDFATNASPFPES